MAKALRDWKACGLQDGEHYMMLDADGEDIGAVLRAFGVNVAPQAYTKGELIALLWSDLDMQNKTISVNKQAVRVKGGGVKVTVPKTSTSIRIDPIPQEAIDLLSVITD